MTHSRSCMNSIVECGNGNNQSPQTKTSHRTATERFMNAAHTRCSCMHSPSNEQIRMDREREGAKDKKTQCRQSVGIKTSIQLSNYRVRFHLLVPSPSPSPRPRARVRLRDSSCSSAQARVSCWRAASAANEQITALYGRRRQTTQAVSTTTIATGNWNSDAANSPPSTAATALTMHLTNTPLRRPIQLTAGEAPTPNTHGLINSKEQSDTDCVRVHRMTDLNEYYIYVQT
jgi:hypothetical protein